MSTTHADSVTLTSVIRGLKGYSFSALRGDLFSGLTVALLALPQSMAYALIAGLPPAVGVLAAIFGTLITALFGASRTMVAGPTNTVAMLLQVATSEILFSFYHGVSAAQSVGLALEVMAGLTFIVGAFQVLIAVLRLDKMAQFVSRPVITGYVLGVAVAIIVGQLFTFTGLSHPEAPSSLLAEFIHISTHIAHCSPVTVGVGLGSLVILFLMRRIAPRLPVAAITLIVAGFSVYFLGDLGSHVALVGHFGPVEQITIDLAPPLLNWQVLNMMLPFGFAIALMGIIEVTSIIRSLGTERKMPLGQEVLGLGIANIASSFVGAMPSSGSFSRSKLNAESGATTHLAAVFSAIFVAILVFVFGSWVSYIPMASLAALLLFTAVALVDSEQLFLCLRTTRSDAIALWVTFAACLLLSLDVAFYAGVLISIGLYLNKAAMPAIRMMTIGVRGQPRPMDEDDRHPRADVRIIDVDGELFFGAVDHFQAEMEAIINEPDVTVVVLRLKNAHHLDVSACLALRYLHKDLEKVSRRLVLCGLTPRVWKVLKRSGLMAQIGPENLFLSDPRDVVGSTGRAFQHAQKLSKGIN